EKNVVADGLQYVRADSRRRIVEVSHRKILRRRSGDLPDAPLVRREDRRVLKERDPVYRLEIGDFQVKRLESGREAAAADRRRAAAGGGVPIRRVLELAREDHVWKG